MGRSGSGPFEFRRIDVVGSLGDTVVVYDAGHSRVSTWLIDGRPVHEIRVDPGINLEGIDKKGRYLGVTTVHMSEYRASGTIENLANIVRLDRAGESGDSLTRLPFAERLVRTDGRSTAAFALPFGRFGLLAPTGSGFCYVYGHLVELKCFNDTGSLISITRVTDVPRQISDEQTADFAHWFASFVADSSGRAAVLKRYRDEWIYPRYSPAIASLIVDQLGCLWLEEYWRPRLGSDDWYSKEAQGTGRWLILSQGGLPIARLTVPAEFTPTSIAPDIMIGVWRDQYGVQTIRGFLLDRGDHRRAPRIAAASRATRT
jgi:hypothetical protein